MPNQQDPTKILASLQGTLSVLAALIAKFEQREARMQATVMQQMQALQRELTQAHERMDTVVTETTLRISQSASDALMPVATKYKQDVSASSARMNRVSAAVWTWFGAAASILVLALLVGWSLLGHYRNELNATRDEFERYENAIPIVQAFYASDAVLCNGRICVNVDPEKPRSGERRQYRPAKQRPQ